MIKEITSVRMLLGVAIGTILMTDLVAAQPATLTLGQAVQQSVEKYPAVRGLLEQVSAAASGINLARTAYLPRADFLGQVNRATPSGRRRSLKLETTISMSDVQGRIDHLSVDLNNQRLFVAALGNNSVEVLDIKGAKRLHTISGLHEPQGVLYAQGENRLFVANAKDGTCRIYDASSFQLLKTIEYGEDADNIRFDAPAKQVYVGYGSGALGVLDLSGNNLGDIKLDAHPESFQLEKKGTRIFVNLPDSRKIAVVDRKTKAVVGQWETGGALANFPMALDEANHRLFAVCRKPAVLVVLNTDSGAVVAKISTVGDSDDVFYDPTRKQIYASGGEGAIAVLQQRDPDHYQEIARIPTVKGARTSLFVSELGRLLLAVRKQGSENAAIRVYAVSQ